MLVNWLTTRLITSNDGEMDIQELYQRYCFESTECGDENVAPGLRVFLIILTSVFPNIEKQRKRQGNKLKTIYKGIELKPLPKINVPDEFEFKAIVDNLCDPVTFDCFLENSVKCSIKTQILSNGNEIIKSLVFNENNTWNMQISGTDVNLESLNICNRFCLNKESIHNICFIASQIEICEGCSVTGSVNISKCQTLETLNKLSTDICKKVLRSINCKRVIPFGNTCKMCRTCQNMTKLGKSNVLHKSKEEQEEDEKCENIKKVLKEADPQLVSLFLEQCKNVSKKPNGRRWSKHFIRVCLQIYNKSPKAYETLVASEILILPSASTLILYKNQLKQKPGLDEELFEWMFNEANFLELPTEARQGGIIFDEMAIQTDIQIEKNGDIVELIGFTDKGKEGDICGVLRSGKKEQQLGTHVLQLLFLGVTGFRFPFAHFITSQIQASELYSLFWKSVQCLFSFGFKVIYTCMDGAVCNRSFLHICVGENKNFDYNFISKSPTTLHDVIFIMDISHVLKKIRNNIIKSGHGPKCTRLLTLPDKTTIQWQMFIDCFKWDQENALQLHRKLSNDHFFPDNQMKMRNHLAEDVLNENMLFLMQQYKQNLGQKGQILDGCISLLQNTSQMVSIFRDMRPIKKEDDQRLQILREVANWFLTWCQNIFSEDSIPQNNKNKCLLSLQCCEDIQSSLQGFISLCNNILKTPSIYVTPGLINSDIIENIFNQQRSTYNGPNTNPNSLQYRKTINSIVIGQSTVSRKSNAGKDQHKSAPFCTDKTLKKRKTTTVAIDDHDIRVGKITKYN